MSEAKSSDRKKNTVLLILTVTSFIIRLLRIFSVYYLYGSRNFFLCTLYFLLF